MNYLQKSMQFSHLPPPPPPGGGTPPPPPAGRPPGPPAPPPPGGPPPVPPRDPHADKLRAVSEMDSAYRELRRAELMIQEIEATSEPQYEHTARHILDIASDLYHNAYDFYQSGEYFKSAEYSVAAKDLVRGIEKIYNVASVS